MVTVKDSLRVKTSKVLEVDLVSETEKVARLMLLDGVGVGGGVAVRLSLTVKAALNVLDASVDLLKDTLPVLVLLIDAVSVKSDDEAC
jgi:hypothetical protein